MDYKLLLGPYLVVIADFIFQSIHFERKNHPKLSIMGAVAKLLSLFLVGGLVYVCMELVFRGHTHWTMFLLGAICFIEIGFLNEIMPWETPLELQAVTGAILVTFNEFVSGCIINLGFGCNVWDYSNLPMNIMGQICIPFTILWIFVSILAIVVDDILRYYLWGEELPRYYSCLWKEAIVLPLKK